MTRAYTIRLADSGPVESAKEFVTDRVGDMAHSLYEALKSLALDLFHFTFVDVFGQLSLILVLISLLAMALGAMRFASRSFKWGLITYIVSLIANFGWGE